MKDFSCQFNSSIQSKSIPIFFCTFQEGSVETQADIPHMVSSQVQVNFYTEKKSVSTSTDLPDKEDNLFTGYSSLENSENLKEFTGVTQKIFLFLLSFIPVSNSKMSLSKENRLLLFLMKMKLGLHYTILGILFDIHKTTASNYFKSVLSLLYEKLKNVVYWPDDYTIQNTMPDSFKLHYPNCTAIINCTEIFCECPPKVDHRKFMFSSFKSNFTLKYLIGILPCGFISFISCGFGGRSTDSYIAINSGFLKYVKLGHQIMADKGFPQIKSHLEENGAVLVMPPFAHRDGKHFTAEECDDTYNIASVRIHVERAIQRIKLNEILKRFTNDLIPDADKIVHMAGVLANLQSPIKQND